MRKLGPAQTKWLCRICASNGGGVAVPVGPDRKTIMRLEQLGLIQGQSGQQWRAVHTKLGLETYREIMAQISIKEEGQ